MRQNVALIFATVLSLGGCMAQPTLIQKESSDRRAITSPAGSVRVDGIYVCRGLKGIGSPGGLGFWPFESLPTQLSFVEFLRFDTSGRVSRWFAEEPATIDQARHLFRDNLAGEWAVTGKYKVSGSNIDFVLSGLTADRRSHSSVPYVGFVYVDYIALDIDHGTIFPDSTRYNYREYEFVADENAASATRPAA